MYDSATIPSRSILVLLTLGLVFSSYARADSVSATLAAGKAPCAIKPVNNEIYVSGAGKNRAVIDRAGHRTRTMITRKGPELGQPGTKTGHVSNRDKLYV